MKFTEAPIKGVFVVELEKRGDDRGFFARIFCVDEFSKHGMNPTIAQINMSECVYKGTVRGLHYQTSEAAEAKFIRCIKGSVFDVCVDVRPESPTYKKWFGVELSAQNLKAAYIPEGFAHGYVSLEDHSQVIYSASRVYTPGSEKGIRYNDQAIGIQWPIEPTIVSDKDKSWPDFA